MREMDEGTSGTARVRLGGGGLGEIGPGRLADGLRAPRRGCGLGQLRLVAWRRAQLVYLSPSSEKNKTKPRRKRKRREEKERGS